MQASTSWRLTAPLRRAGLIVRRESAIPGPAEASEIGRAPEQWTDPAGESGLSLPPPTPQEPRATRTVHQFHFGAAPQDAITNAMLLTRSVLRGLGYRSDIFVEHRDPALADEVHLLTDMPPHGDYVLIVRHSMGHDQLDRILALKARKILLYHNTTPRALLDLSPHERALARLGREQLARLKPHVAATLADSEYNAVELRALGFDPVQVCPMLVDIAALRGASVTRDADAPFTVLFVGRITESKNQLGLIESFAQFRTAFGRPARLVLAGKLRVGDAYLESLFATIRRLGLDGEVLITGHVSDEERDAWYGAADLYVSLSQHEGFGVPLLEAMAYAVPVLAWPAGAVGETLGDGAELLPDLAPSAVADRMLKLARDPGRRAQLAAAGERSLQRFALDRHTPRLVEALLRAGAAPLPDPNARGALAASMRFAVTGHVRGTYSLAAINRALAAAIEAARPGTVRLLPVEGEPIVDLTGVPADQRRMAMALAGRPSPATGPEIVISQHYPLYEPPNPGDLPLALFFWEELVIPAATVDRLNAGFRAVLAPRASSPRRSSISGVARPVRVLGQAPPLAAFRELAGRRPDAGPGGPTTFLHVSSCFPRKGVDALLAAYARAFRRGDPVRLVIKGFPNPHNDVAEQIAALRARDPDVADITFINEDLSEADLLGLFRDASAVVLPTRGEGYNLPAAEALAAGVPLIVTAHGGHCDFCGPEEARLIDYAFAVSESHLASAGSVSVDPDVADLASALAEHVKRPDQARERAQRGAARILAETAPAALVARLTDIALDLLLAPPPVPLRIAWVSTWDVRCGIAEYSRHLLNHLPGDGLAEIVVLADTRSVEREGVSERRVRPVWRIGDPAGVGALAAALTRADPHAIVLQHQPGLIPWELLARFLNDAVRAERVVVAVLHNTRDLLRAGEADRLAAVAALGKISRVLVHTVADLKLLKGLGLTANVTMLLHGIEVPLPPSPARGTRPIRAGSDRLLRLPSARQGSSAVDRGHDPAAPKLAYGQAASGERAIRRPGLGRRDHGVPVSGGGGRTRGRGGVHHRFPAGRPLSGAAAGVRPSRVAVPSLAGGVQRGLAHGADGGGCGRCDPAAAVRRGRRRGVSP